MTKTSPYYDWCSNRFDNYPEINQRLTKNIYYFILFPGTLLLCSELFEWFGPDGLVESNIYGTQDGSDNVMSTIVTL